MTEMLDDILDWYPESTSIWSHELSQTGGSPDLYPAKQERERERERDREREREREREKTESVDMIARQCETSTQDVSEIS